MWCTYADMCDETVEQCMFGIPIDSRPANFSAVNNREVSVSKIAAVCFFAIKIEGAFEFAILHKPS